MIANHMKLNIRNLPGANHDIDFILENRNTDTAK